MSRWASRINRRHARRHPWLTALSILGIALGVAVFVSIRLANESARRAFELSSQAVIGAATHRLVAGPAGFDERLYAKLRLSGVVSQAAPVVEADVSSPRTPGRPLRLLGVDVFAEAAFRPWLGGAEVQTADLMTGANAVLVPEGLAQALGLNVGDALPLVVSGGDREVRVGGVFSPADPRTRRATEDLLICDIATAQELLDRVGRLDRVDLILRPGQAEKVSALLPPEVSIEGASAQAQSLGELTRAFALNLTALSLLALLVGMFLIYNTMTFAVVQRRPTLGTLRAIGVTPRELFSLILGDALWIAIPGTLVGIAGGILLARGLVRLVARTINDLYFSVEVQRVEVAPSTLLVGALLGVLATLLSALHPAIEAAQAPPVTVIRRSTQEDRTRRALPRLTLFGVVLTCAGLVLLVWPSPSLPLAFAGLFSVLLGLALIVPLATWTFGHLARRPLGAVLGSVGRMAAGGVSANLSRTSVAVAALTVSVAMAIAVGAMVQSFRLTVVRWLDASLLADVYVTAPGLVGRRSSGGLPKPLAAKLARVPGAAGVFTVRTRRIRTDRGPADLVAPSFGGLSLRPYQLAVGDPKQVWPRFERGEGVIISEPFAYMRRLKRGDSVTLFTDRGPTTRRILAVFYDYASSAGAVLLPRGEYDQLFDDPYYSGIAVFAAPGVDANALAQSVRAAMGDLQARVQPTRGLKDASLAVFDRTFTITQVLRVLALAVSFIGVFSALLALQLERSRELALLRAVGLLPTEVWKLVIAQTGLMGLVAGVLALPVGWVMASALVYVINRRSFGWTLELSFAPALVAQAVLLAIVAAVLAGIYPALRMARTSPALALKEAA